MLPRNFAQMLVGRGGTSLRPRSRLQAEEPIRTVRPDGAVHPSQCYFEVQGPVDEATAPVTLTPVQTDDARAMAAELKALAATRSR